MSEFDSPVYPRSEIEALIAALRGVLATRVALGADGQLEEVNVLADAELHPKQIVRNVESALAAGLGITIDRRRISVAPINPDSPEPYDAADALALQLGQSPEQGRMDERDENIAGRYVFVGYDARTRPDLEAACRVTIRRGRHAISGAGTGPSTLLGRAQAAARAIFAAISVARDDELLGLEGVTLVDSHGRSYVLVSASAATGRSAVPLTGAAVLQRSPEEAAILASLQATNRWAE